MTEFEGYFISDFTKIEIVTPVNRRWSQGYGGYEYGFRINGITSIVFYCEWDEINQKSLCLINLKIKCEKSREKLIELIRSAHNIKKHKKS